MYASDDGAAVDPLDWVFTLDALTPIVHSHLFIPLRLACLVLVFKIATHVLLTLDIVYRSR